MLEIAFPQGWFPPDAPAGTLCYLIRQEQGWLMVDCGLKHRSCLESLRGQLAALNISPRDIKWLLITHFHPDHFGLAAELRDISGAQIILHRLDWEVLPHELDGYDRVFEFGTALFPAAVEPDLLLDGQDQPMGDTGLRAMLTPGHTPGHVCVYDEGNRLLFSGDHVLTGITTHITPGILSDDDQLGRYLESLQRVQSLDVQMVLPAHETPFERLSDRVEQLLEHHEQRLQQVLAPIRLRACEQIGEGS